MLRVVGKRVKNLQYRKHRFDSQQRPLAKFILFFDAFVKVAIHLAADRNHSDTAHAEEFLSQVTDQQLILLSMCADASDEAVRLIRYFDSDTWDIASMQYECSVYASRLKHLFLDGQVVHSGYTQAYAGDAQEVSGLAVPGPPEVNWRCGGGLRISSGGGLAESPGVRPSRARDSASGISVIRAARIVHGFQCPKWT